MIGGFKGNWYLNSKITSAFVFVNDQQFPSFYPTFYKLLALRESVIYGLHLKKQISIYSFRSSVEHWGWQTLKILPQDFCSLVMQSDTNLGTAAKVFVIKATVFLLLNKEVHLDYPSGHIRGALQRRRGRQKSHSEGCGRGRQERLNREREIP